MTLDITALEFLASRICHDLISPVGAVHNGVEFLEETGLSDGEEAVGLIAHSAKQAAARLQIFRLAYGAGGRDPSIKPADVKKAFDELFGMDGRVKQDWNAEQISADGKPEGFCKILTCGIMMAVECLPKGGTISVSAKGSGTVVTAAGPDAAPRPTVKEALERKISSEKLDPRLVHPYVFGLLAREYGFSISLLPSINGKVEIQLS
ncbi:MAG: hypothetical protein HY370_01625 [Proteobacteria bacterium]|nr:hypothetical protein [Pseudomonadota bacterium]